jgi:amino acid adenylation domain-containing protein
MADIKDILLELKNANAQISLDGERLLVQAREGGIDERLRSLLKDHKENLIEYIRKRTAVHPGGIPPLSEHSEGYELSSAQMRLWILSRFEDANIAYNMPACYLFDGDLDKGCLEQAFVNLIQRHEILRTIFKADAQGEPRQFVLSAEKVAFRIDHTDLSMHFDGDRRVRALVQEAVSKPFDLSCGPLFRANLYGLAHRKWIFVYNIHHIISDGLSMDILVNELLFFYNALVGNMPAILPPLRIQYKDYAAWQREQLRCGALKEHRNYWLKKFGGELAVLDLPADNMRPVMLTYNGGAVVKPIRIGLVEKLKEIAHEQGASLFMCLLSLIKILLYRYTGQQDIIVGCPVGGREHADLEDQIGLYVNTLALRTRFGEEDSFIDLLNKIKTGTLESYQYQAYPFEELVRELNLKRDTGRNALFDVMVIMRNSASGHHTREGQIHGLQVSGYEDGEIRSSKFDLVFDLFEAQETLQLTIEFNSDIYNRPTIVRMADHLEQLLMAIIREPLTPVERLDYLSEEEKERIFMMFNDTDMDYPEDHSVIDLVEEQVRRTPDRVALRQAGREMTYRELGDRSDRLARFLQQNEVKEGSIVSIYMERSMDMIISILAVLKNGGTYVPVDPEYPVDRILYMLEDSGTHLLLTDETLLSKADTIGKPKIIINEDLLSRVYACTENSLGPRSFNSIACIIYTSGSSGKPKGVRISNKSIVNRLSWMWNAWPFKENERCALKTSVGFVDHIAELFSPLAGGVSSVMFSKDELLDLDRFMEKLSLSGITRLVLVPSLLGSMLERCQKDSSLLKGITHWTSSGEELTNDLVKKFAATFPLDKYTLLNIYGSTEVTADVTCKTIRPADITTGIKSASIGRPIANTRVYILDKAGNPCPIGCIGELYVGGAQVASGYVNLPALTNQRFVADLFTGRKGERLFRTGDLAKWSADGSIDYLGRKDSQVKIRGCRIEIGEIESVLKMSGLVAGAVVDTRTDNNGDKRLVAYVQPVDNQDPGTIKKYLQEKLPAYMLPSAWVEIKEIPVNANGKTDRRRLPEPDLTALMKTGYEAPGSDMQRKLADIWQDHLKISRVGIHDDLFELGGHSLLAIRLTAAIKNELNVELSVRVLFQFPTIKLLSDHITISNTTHAN